MLGIDEKFGTKERIMEYNSNEESEITNNEIFQKTNNDLQNSVQSETTREE